MEFGVGLCRGVAGKQPFARVHRALPVADGEVHQPAELEEEQVVRMQLGAEVDERLRERGVSAARQRGYHAIDHIRIGGIRGEQPNPNRCRIARLPLRIQRLSQALERGGIGRRNVEQRARDREDCVGRRARNP